MSYMKSLFDNELRVIGVRLKKRFVQNDKLL